MEDVRNQPGETRTRGRYVMAMPGGELAELTYVESGPGHIIVDHTWVPPKPSRPGAALKLVVKAVEDARAAGTGSRRSAPMSPPSSAITRNGRTC